MVGHGVKVVLGLVSLTWQMQAAMADCPLDLSGSNFTLAASICSKEDRGKCCRYINAFVAVAISQYANVTNQLGVPPELSDICLQSVSETLILYGIPSNATIYCGLGLKIPVSYQCKGHRTILEMRQSPMFDDVVLNCKMPLSTEGSCRRCLNASILYLHRLVGADDNTTLNTCRDATFVTLTSQGDNVSTNGFASCFFGVQGLSNQQGVVSEPSSQLLPPQASPGPQYFSIPNQHSNGIALNSRSHPYHLTLIPGLGIAVTGVAFMLLIILILLIRQKSRELQGSGSPDRTSWKGFQPPWRIRKCHEGLSHGPSSMFRRFSYKETKKATDNFSTVIGRGGFGTVYKAQFDSGLILAVKRMNKVSEQGEEEFCCEMELLGRLHHRHLVALKGFCIELQERFLMYEHMENGSLKDHLHSSGKASLGWRTRIQIAIDVANALEYLHFYCDPPLCHRDIKSSNILLDGNFVAKVADFGLAHVARNGAISFEPVNTDIRGTPGYMDPEYVVTQELTEKSDIYSYGVVLLELVTARRAIQENKNLVEWAQKFMAEPARLPELVDPTIADAYDFEQLQAVVTIVRLCTQREGRFRPSIKQVLRLLYERIDPLQNSFSRAVEREMEDGFMGAGGKSKGKVQRGDVMSYSGDARCLQSSSSTSRSYCSRSFLLENGSPQSPPGIFSV
ncbi:probable receptor-like protein kinase At1g49730 isoform X1 [Amborella trichopoda]|uniref:probable receptor-like protein kinase At1g49730 isoform X1 n=2 Tax=Amborella trichopoda TaxID=13333 RepID=UPI0009BFDF13|nr:probable receptor-like protein kinase At1g49730 isoform X1 [Amborella trichopoda]|eukprot:XP_020524531.1 probable receptor-like protein kinase At1g49730 isoform X1 [Amborella trichopoda]